MPLLYGLVLFARATDLFAAGFLAKADAIRCGSSFLDIRAKYVRCPPAVRKRSDVNLEKLGSAQKLEIGNPKETGIRVAIVTRLN